MESEPEFDYYLLELLITMAWADGEIQKQELAFIKTTIKENTDVGEVLTEKLLMMLAQRSSVRPFADVLEDLKDSVTCEADKYKAVHLLRRIIQADGVIEEKEIAQYDAIVEELRNCNNS